MTEAPTDIETIVARLEAIDELDEQFRAQNVKALAGEQLVLAEQVLATWVIAHGGEPTGKLKEGFRLLALHSQGARGEPSFHACRETSREVVFHYNVIDLSDVAAEQAKALKLMTMVVRHLALFVSGKLEVAGLGDFCCASKPLRQPAAVLVATADLEKGATR
jgi:hypothetical protein